MITHPAAALGFLFAGLIIWAVRFLTVYSFTALACAKGFAGETVVGIGIVPAFIGAATVVAIAANGWVIVRGATWARRRQPVDEFDPIPFLGYTAAAVAVLAVIAIVWEALPALIIPVCVSQ